MDTEVRTLIGTTGTATDEQLIHLARTAHLLRDTAQQNSVDQDTSAVTAASITAALQRLLDAEAETVRLRAALAHIATLCRCSGAGDCSARIATAALAGVETDISSEPLLVDWGRGVTWDDDGGETLVPFVTRHGRHPVAVLLDDDEREVLGDMLLNPPTDAERAELASP